MKIPEGYVDVGWQREHQAKEVINCYNLKHIPYSFDNSSSKFRGRYSNVVYICDECKIAWHVDESD